MDPGKLLLVISFLSLLGCQRVEKPRITKEIPKNVDLPEPQKLPADLQVLTINKSLEEERPVLDDYLFGKFFQDRAVFFVIQNSTSTLFDARVNTAILYYLDGEHCKTKFIMSEDIGPQLIARYGNFKIIPLDDLTKELLAKEEVIVADNHKRVINKSFRKYELLWKLNTKIVRFKVDPENSTEPYVYTEHVLQYDNLYRSLESES